MDTVQHEATLLQTMRLFYQRHLLTDFDIITSDPTPATVPVHKVVVAAFCHYFREKLEAGTLNESSHVLEGVNSVTLSTLVDFMYTGHLEVNDDTISAVFSLANHLGAPMATDACQKYLKTKDEDPHVMVSASPQAEDQHQDKFESDTESTLTMQKTNIRKTYTRKRKIKVEPDLDVKPFSTVTDKKKSRSQRVSARKKIDESPTFSEKRPRKKTKKKMIKYDEDEKAVAKSVRKCKKIIKSEHSTSVQTASSSDVPMFTRTAYMTKIQHCCVCKEAFLLNSKRHFHERTHGILPLSVKIAAFRITADCRRFCSSVSDLESVHSVGQQPLIINLPGSNGNQLEMGDLYYTGNSQPMPGGTGDQFHSYGMSWNHNAPYLHHVTVKDHNAPNLHDAITKYHNSSNKQQFVNTKSAISCSGKIIYSQPYKETKMVFNINKARYKCLICQKTFILYSFYLSHFVASHRMKQKCHHCQKRFPSVKYLLLHQRLEHADLMRKRVQMIRCVECCRAFLHQRAFDHHLKQGLHARKSKMLLYCQNCDKSYKTGSIFGYHPCYSLMFPALNTRYQNNCRLAFITKSIIKKRRIKRKIKRLYPDKSQNYHCQYCGATFVLRFFGEMHVRLRHSRSRMNQKLWEYKQRRMQCDEAGCNHKCTTMLRLIRHVRVEHPDVIHNCIKCPFVTPVLRRLSQHILKEHGGGKTCEICGRKYAKLQQLRIHRVAIHDQQDPKVTAYPCPRDDCDYVGYTRTIIDKHQQKHAEGHQFPCHYCDRRLKTENNLTKHISKVHMGIRPFICDQCGANYGEENELKMHMARHDTEWRFHCEQCQYVTQDKGNLKSHMFYRHKLLMDKRQKLFRCDVCGYTSHRKTRFSDHMNIHADVRQFKCKICEKMFMTKSTLEGHMKWKHSNQEAQCTYCEYKTKTKNHLKEHVRVMHTQRNVKPYKCPYCEFRCATSGNCRKHVMNKHKGMVVRWVKIIDQEQSNEMANFTGNLKTEDANLKMEDQPDKLLLRNVTCEVYNPQQMAAPAENSLLQNLPERQMELSGQPVQQMELPMISAPIDMYMFLPQSNVHK